MSVPQRMFQNVAGCTNVIRKITGMRLVMMSTTRLETYAFWESGQALGMVVMPPMEDGTHQLRADFHCFDRKDCDYCRRQGPMTSQPEK